MQRFQNFMALAAIPALLTLTILGGGRAAAEEAAPKRTLETVVEALSRGGAVILMRHANAPEGQAASTGLTQGCDFSDGRGLDAKGFFQARFIGEFFKTEGVPVAIAYTSDVCRAWDTARLVAAGAPVTVEPALRTTNRSEIDAFKTVLSTALGKGAASNVVLVTHSNVVPLFADWGSAEEIPSGLILIVDPATWTVRDKLNMDVDLSIEGGG